MWHSLMTPVPHAVLLEAVQRGLSLGSRSIETVSPRKSTENPDTFGRHTIDRFCMCQFKPNCQSSGEAHPLYAESLARTGIDATAMENARLRLCATLYPEWTTPCRARQVANTFASPNLGRNTPYIDPTISLSIRSPQRLNVRNRGDIAE